MQLSGRRFFRRDGYKIQKNLTYPFWDGAAIDTHRGDEISVGDNVFFRGNENSSGRRLSYKVASEEYMASYQSDKEKPFTRGGITASGIAIVAAVLLIMLLFTACCGAYNVKTATQSVMNIQTSLESAQERNTQLRREVNENQTDMVVLKKVIDESQMISSKGVTHEYLQVSTDSVIKPNVPAVGESLFAISQMK